MDKMIKPRLVFFQWDHKASPPFIKLHMQLHVKCLSEFFELILINEDCNYKQICDAYQPDLTLFESGYRTSVSRKLAIKNALAYPEIPKLGLHNGDPWCDCRIGFMADMDRWGIETYFSISISTAEHTPAIAENLYIWPNFIDSDVHKDYHQEKVIPVLFNGSVSPLYPWRQKVLKVISNRYPTLVFPHLGYESHSPMMIHGEYYARTLNASWFVPACGTVGNEIVRKHFEIPACKSCLVTERIPFLEAAGFVDMENCVFADERDVVDKLNYLFSNPKEIERITNAGFALVHAYHILKQRNQIFQWFELQKNLKCHQRIRQENPFGPLRVVEKVSGVKDRPIKCEGLHLRLLRQGDEKLWAGKYEEAEALYLKCLNYISYMHEPKLRLTICNLYKGNAAEAMRWVKELNLNSLGNNRSSNPDPVEWTFLIISLLCQGKLSEAVIRASQFPLLNHTELFRTRCIIEQLQKGANDFLPWNKTLPNSRLSIHQLPQLSFIEWVHNLLIMLKACKQSGYVEMLKKLLSQKRSTSNELRFCLGIKWKKLLLIRLKWLEKLSSVFEVLQIPDNRPGLPPISEVDYIIRLGRWMKMNHIKRFIQKCLLQLRNFIEISKNELNQVVQELLKKEDIKTILLIGSSDVVAMAGSIIPKQKKGIGEPLVFSIHILNTQPVKLQPAYSEKSALKFYEFVPSSSESLASDLKNYIKRIQLENEIGHFDLLFIDGCYFKYNEGLTEMQEVGFVVLNNINIATNYREKEMLLSDPRYTLVAQNPMCQNGYAILKKVDEHCLRSRFSYLWSKQQEHFYKL